MDFVELGKKYLFFDSDFCSYVDAVKENYEEAGFDSAEEYEEDLYNDQMAFDLFWDDEIERLAYELSGLGLLKEEEDYIALGSKMGWRSRSGHRVFSVKEAGDIIDALHGNYDFEAKVFWTGGSHYLEASVYTHDAPTGEHYYIIPKSWIEQAVAESEDIERAMHLAVQNDYDADAFLNGEETAEKHEEARWIGSRAC